MFSVFQHACSVSYGLSIDLKWHGLIKMRILLHVTRLT